MTLSTYKKTWQNNYWKLYGVDESELSIPSDMSIVDNILLVSTMNEKDNLKLFEISAEKS
ncbi:BEM_collapsed_G0016490.mRNA.1.CDS.1 [Saccharomyces cerevisiae]|nr:BEM_collapsed_G0016490.mRNA.1.CDS.1 [Saccharomyces cerevisiae]